MNVLLVAAEMAPLVKVGGLADVAGALPRALRKLGLDVRVALPFYGAIDRRALRLEKRASLPGQAALWSTAAGGVPVYLIEQAPSFTREDVYGHEDDLERFLTFDDLLLAAAGSLDWSPDILHLHDWHTGLIATRLAGQEHPWATLPRVFTIHNLGFSGPFDSSFAERHSIAKQTLEAPPGVAEAVACSALGQGILHSNAVTAVSETYAREIQDEAQAGEFAPLLRSCKDRLTGILNGIDYELYDPATDRHLAANFDARSLDRRIENKRVLQQQVGLPAEDGTPLLAMVARLFQQKGIDLAADAVDAMIAANEFQFVVLGEGDEDNEARLGRLATRYPEQVAVVIDFDAALGQLIYGGCDMFLMPSRYEPCGLGQMMAMRYGAVPVVRRTGGLADTVDDCDEPLSSGNGFVFDEPTAKALTGAIGRALDAYRQPAAWRALQQRCLARDFSWAASAARYAQLYEGVAAASAGRSAAGPK